MILSDHDSMGGQTIRVVAALSLFSLVVSALTWRTVTHLHQLGREDDALRFGMCDFRDVIYFPTRAVLDGVNPYDSEPTSDASRYLGRYPAGNVFPLYSPLLILLDSPLQLLPYHFGMAFYGIFNVALVALVAWLALRANELNGGIVGTIILATAMLVSRPGQSNFYYGQLALPMTLCAIVATQWTGKRPAWAILSLVLATIKPTFGGPLLIMLLCQRQWKVALWGGAVGGGLAALGFAFIFLFCSPGKPALAVLRENVTQTEADPGFDAQQTGIRLDAVLIAERLLPTRYADAAKAIVPVVILALSGLVLWLLSNRAMDPTCSWILAPLVMVTTLLCVFHAAYDALLLTMPIVGLIWGPRAPGRGKVDQGIRWILMGLLLMPAVNVFSSRQFLNAVQPYLGTLASTQDGSWLWSTASILNGMCLLIAWMMLVVVGMRMALRPDRPYPA
jgi:hypothetical protein